MHKIIISLLLVYNANQECSTTTVYPRSVPLVERAPLLLNSFLPSAMQIIAHCTELFKYDVQPAGNNPTSTTTRPTPPHSPGIYAPRSPLRAALRKTTFDDYLVLLKEAQGASYFDRYKIPLQSASSSSLGEQNFNSDKTNFWSYFKTNDIAKDLELLGQRPTNILKQVTRDDDYDFVDDDLNIQIFSGNYDESSFRSYVIGNKVTPPPRAYVTLLTLYDLMNKEAKKLQLNKYGGYADEVLLVLIESSIKTAAYQLKIVLNKILERQDTTDQNIIKKIKLVVEDLDQNDSYLNDALKYIPPLVFSQ